MSDQNSFNKNLLTGLKSRIKKTFHNPYREVNINWASLKYLKHLPADKIHSHKLLQHETFFYGGLEYLHGVKEIFLEGVYKQELPENAAIIDCGAHIGLSVIYLKSICPTAHIVCFEPDTKNFDLLQENISSHQLRNVEIKKEAVWIENTQLNFIQDGNMGSKIGDDNSSNSAFVKAIRLKDYLNKEVDFLKMDIEGAEYKVLKDISESLKNISKMFIEYHGTFEQNNELLEILDLVTKAGFKFYIKEAASILDQPFLPKTAPTDYDLQLNIFCIKNVD
ncbi:MAG: FkbM family methyltransferase [Ginsengibacter sp.]